MYRLHDLNDYIGVADFCRQNQKTHLITIDATEVETTKQKKIYGIDGNEGTVYVSAPNPEYGQYYGISIQNMMILVKSYILSYKFECYPKIWEFQTSMDNTSWHTADLQSTDVLKNKELNNFPIAPTVAKYFRIVHRGNNSCRTPDTRLHIGEFDIKGSIINYASTEHSFPMKNNSFLVYLFLIVYNSSY